MQDNCEVKPVMMCVHRCRDNTGRVLSARKSWCRRLWHVNFRCRAWRARWRGRCTRGWRPCQSTRPRPERSPPSCTCCPPRCLRHRWPSATWPASRTTRPHTSSSYRVSVSVTAHAQTQAHDSRLTTHD